MSLPYYVWCDSPAVGLFELADGRFQTIERGPIAPFMAGPGYLLVEASFAGYLQSLAVERVIYKPVVLFLPDTGEEVRSYNSLKVGQFFQPDEINDLALDGLRILSMGEQYFFVSPGLKELLSHSPFRYLKFSEGLSGFASERRCD